MECNTSTCDELLQTDVAEFLRLIHAPGSVFEIRSLKCPDRPGSSYTGTASGVFNDIESAVKCIAELEKCKPPAIYVTANSVNPALLARATNHIVHGARATTSDSDIIRRLWLPVDIDPIRPAGISSTDHEMNSAIELSKIIEQDLRSDGWPEPIRGMSGNGAYLLYSIDLENTPESTALIQNCLIALGSIYTNEVNAIDQSMFNAARIIKVLGTTARKGDDFPGVNGSDARPHRRSWYIPPEVIKTVGIELLQALAARKPTAETKAYRSEYSESNFQIDQWLSDKYVPVSKPRPYKGGRIWPFDELPLPCKGSPSGHEHDNSAFIIEMPNGALSAGCQHDRCKWGWRDLRQAYEPGCYNDASTDGVDISALLPTSVHTTSSNPGEKGVVCTTAKREGRKHDVPARHEYAPFPVACLPELLRQFIENGARAMCRDPSFMALPLLTGLAGAIGNSMSLIVKQGWFVPPILWTVVVAESGSTKSPPFRMALRPLYQRQRKLAAEFDTAWRAYELEQERYLRDLANYRKSKSGIEAPPEPPLKPICPRCLVSDATIEALGARLVENPRGVISDNHELSAWFGSFNRYNGKVGADEASWLKFFNGEHVVIDRKSSPRPMIIDRATVFLTGTIQPGILRRHLSAEHRESGLASRLLFAMPPRIKKTWTDFEPDPLIQNQVEAVFERLFSLEMKSKEDELVPNFISLNGQAKQLFVDQFNRHNIEQNELQGDLYAAYSKLEECTARLALVLHCVRWAIGDLTDNELLKVDAKSMASGIRLCEWFKQEARRVYSVLSENELESENRKLHDWLERKGVPLTAAEIYQSQRRNFDNSEEIELLLSKFVNAGLGVWIEVTPTEQGGRPTRKYMPHPTVCTHNP